jgi:alpha-L-rhamnosidase
MKTTLLFSLLLAPLLAHAIEPTSLKTEYLENPLGLDTAKPRFSWIVEDATPGAKQSAYQVQVASSPDKLASGKADLWDTGKIASDETLGIEYGGSPLASRSFAYWRIKAWDGDGKESAWSEPARFSIGLLQPQDWQAKWITAPQDDSVPPNFGFRSKEAASDSESKWVQVDLGQEQSVDGIALWGAWTADKQSPPGDGLPLRFKVEVAQKEDFSDAKLVLDRSKEDITGDITAIGVGPLRLSWPPVNDRYVRLTATKLSGSYKRSGPQPGVWSDAAERWVAIPEPKKNNYSRWKLALAEMEIFSGQKNVARGAKVSTSDSIEDDPKAKIEDYERAGLKKEYLTDGRTEGTPGTRLSPVPVPLLRRTFDVAKPVKRATLYSTALGNYEARLNGKKVGDEKLAPGWVNYAKRVLYQTHDVTGLLHPGPNALAASLAEGWFMLREGQDNYRTAARKRSWHPARFLGQLEIEYTDGSREVVATDDSWQCYTDGPIRYASMYNGIAYDARKEVPGWDQPGTPPGKWTNATTKSTFGPDWKIALTAQTHEPVRVLRTIAPVKVSEPKPGVKIYDFGTSIAGFCRVTLDGPAGTEVKLRYAEALKPDGTLYVGNLNGLYDNGDRYILDGKEELTFEPDFTYHGFRYVEVTGDPSAVKNLVASDLSTDTRKTGFFESSDPRLNKLVEIIERAYRANTPSTTIDCAGRDERAPWMGDCFTDEVQSLSYLFGSAGLFANTVRGAFDTVNPEGTPMGIIIMSQPPGKPADAGWADSGIAGAWGAWVNYGDRRTLELAYAASARFMDAVAAKMKDGLPGDNYKSHYGDWLGARQTIKPGAGAWDQLAGIGAPSDLFAAAILAESLDQTARMAEALGKKEEAQRYAQLRVDLQTAILKKFVRADGTIEGGSPELYNVMAPARPQPAGGDEQSPYALLMGHLPDDLRALSRQKLLAAIDKQEGHFGTGSFTTIYLLRALADNGLQDLAYEMVMNPTFPSYGFMVDQGATAMWERWDSYHPKLGFNPDQMNDFIHLGQNSVYEWIFGTLAGIRPDPANPAYKHFFIAPQPPQGLDWVKARYDSVRGPIAVEWKKKDSALNLTASVPANTTATVKLPGYGGITVNGKPKDKSEFTLAAGKWEIIANQDNQPK